MVYIVNDGGQVISSRSGDNNLLSACGDVCRSLVLGGVEACTLQNYVNIQLSPGKLCSIGLCINLNLFSIHNNGIFRCRHGICQRIFALRRIIFQ